jgi:hypothetical protein
MKQLKLDRRNEGLGFLAGGGEMGRLIRSMNWSATALGPAESWPQSLRTTVSLCLASNFPMCIAWGPNHVMTYNDGYWPICGGKHPRSMGQDFSECWASAWPVIGEPFARALAGQASFIENQRMFLDRHGYLEETFFTFSFSPIRDETGGVGGVLNPCHETTARMLSERRTRALRDLSARTGKAKSVEDVLVLSAQTLTEYDLDLPFVLLYAQDSSGQQLRLIARTGLQAGADACPDVLDLEESAGSFWPVAEVFRSGVAAQVDEIGQRLGPPPYGPYPEPPRTALLLPAIPTGAEHPAAVLVAGVSPRLPLNEAYSNFYDLLAAAVTAAIANARAFEAKRSARRNRPREDRLLQQREPRISHAAHADARPGGRHALAQRQRVVPGGEGATGSRQPQRASAPAARQHPAGLLSNRGRARPCDLSADRRLVVHLRPGERVPPGLRARRAETVRRLFAADGADLRRSRHVGEDRPESSRQCLQVHLRRRDRGDASAG